MRPKHVHRAGTTALSLAMVVIGIALTIQAIGGHAVMSARLLLGLLFLAAGSLRIYLTVIRSRDT
jgi:hypothetical protein